MDRGGAQRKEVQALQEGAGQAAKPGSVWPRSTDRLNTSIVKREEQLAGFTQLLKVVARSTGHLEGFTGGPSQTQEVWQEL